jgi:hypothetical protein
MIIEGEPTPASPAEARGWGDFAALALAGIACLMAGIALLLAHGRAAPAAEALLLAARPPIAREAALPLVGAELLLPHLARPAPFPRALALAQALAGGDLEVLRILASLGPAAAEGAPQARQLLEGFEAAADLALLAEMGLGADAGWLARRAAATMRLGASLGSAGTPVLAALELAGGHLARGEWLAAEQSLSGLSGAPAAALAPWRAGLARRLAADRAAAQLAALVLARSALPGEPALLAEAAR